MDNGNVLSMNNSILTLVVLLQVCFLISTIFSPIVWAAEGSWATLESMPTARVSFGVAVVDGKIYAIGGYNDSSYLDINEMYDPETDIWTTKASMPTARASFGIAVYQNKIYVMGGAFTSSSNISTYSGINEVYDPSTNTWETREPMPTARIVPVCGNINDKIYVIGGIILDESSYPSFGNVAVTVNEVYDPLTDSWSTKTSAQEPIEKSASTVLNNKIYGIPHYSPMQIYDAETDEWSAGASILTKLLSASAGATTGINAPEMIYVIGGTSAADYPSTPTNLTQVYDPNTDTWTTGTPMLTPRWGCEIAVVNDELYAIGGRNGTRMLSAVNEKYTPADYIPEFPSWAIAPLLVTATVVIVILRKKLTKRSS